MIKHINLKIHGLVQGVIFRYSAKIEADKLGLVGFAKNLDDETLYIEAEGEEKNLNKFLQWCKKGPSLAKVEKLEITKGELKNFPKFSTY